MWAKSRPAPGSDPARQKSAPGTRRAFLRNAALLAGAIVWPIRPRSAAAETTRALPESTMRLLESSEFVYVSPLNGGRESRCHGEVWYAWLDGTVVLITARSTWKGRALARGLDRARIWVGNHGRFKGWFSNNEAFRAAPRFDAQARIDPDPALLERLMRVFAEKYPDEFADWETEMRTGFASGARILVRYAPTSAG